jgi:hypothetical protein
MKDDLNFHLLPGGGMCDLWVFSRGSALGNASVMTASSDDLTSDSSQCQRTRWFYVTLCGTLAGIVILVPFRQALSETFLAGVNVTALYSGV